MTATPDRAPAASGVGDSTDTQVPRPDEQEVAGTDGAAGPRSRSANIELESLAPRYEPRNHAAYVARLEQAIKDPKNLNIALTGRYGSGKSSVLDEFHARHQKRTLRLAISTLAPDETSLEEDPPDRGELAKTNRIQKEVVKQLVYGASRKVGKNSRFSRIAVPSQGWVFTQFAVLIAVVGFVFFIFDRLPEMRTFFPGQPSWMPTAVWLSLGVFAALLLTKLRLSLHGQFRISDVKAAGASVSLTDQAPSYFDKYLDELVHYFEEESKDIVVFEDLDRFNDPQIFQALRELNVLLNDTPKRRRRRRGNLVGRALGAILHRAWPDRFEKARRSLPMEWQARLLGTGVPLRFIYAVKDSLFEKLGSDTQELADTGDATAAETLRANRTKFFDIVIPLVPFISHRNARELLAVQLKRIGIHDQIDRRLQTMVAKHVTDMRLLRNICNEYLVFAERLLDSDKIAPGLDPSKLFALVAYKNFHLADFEDISRGDSALDRLYDMKTERVRLEISVRRAKLRTLIAMPTSRQQAELAASLGAKLMEVARAMRAATDTYRGSPLQFRIGGNSYTEEDTATWDFWATTARHGALAVVIPGRNTTELSWASLVGVMPELGNTTQWTEVDESARHLDIAAIEAAIEEFRGADFQELVSLTASPEADGDEGARPHRPEASTHPETPEGPAPAQARTFSAEIDASLESDLARDLVKAGFIDQNFTLYAAAFYGTFVGVDVANFMVHNVQPNAMTVDYHFTTPGAVDNLLAETDEEFLRTVAALNVDIVDHLLCSKNPDVARVVERLVETPDQDASDFLAAFFTSGKHRTALAAELAGHPWGQIFVYLTGSPDVPDDVRPDLVSSALAAAGSSDAYHLDNGVRAHFERHYSGMPVLAEVMSQELARTVADLFSRAGAVIPDLARVKNQYLRDLFISRSQYELTAANLRTALHLTDREPIDLDRLGANEYVFGYSMLHAETLLDVMEMDPVTVSTILSPEVLSRALSTVVDDSGNLADSWNWESVERLLDAASPDSSLTSLEEVPTASWPYLAAAGLFDATMSNFRTYQGAFEVDRALADHLRASGLRLDVDGTLEYDENLEEEKNSAAITLLNATTLTPEERVAVVTSLNLAGPLEATRVNAEPSNLFALLLEAGWVADDAATFKHLRTGGWPAVLPAIKASTNVASFMDETLLPGMAAELLADPASAQKVGHLFVTHVDKYLPAQNDDANAAALGALARFAERTHQRFPASVVIRIAKAKTASASTVLALLANASPPPAASDVAAVFGYLGGEYAKVNSNEPAGFLVPKDDTHEALLNVLKDADKVRFKKMPRQDTYKVEVIVRA